MLCKERRKEIREKANAVRTLYDIKGAVDLDKILEKEEIKLFTSDLDNVIEGKQVSGIIRVETDKKIKEIYINGNHIDTRNTFTIGHELGHYFLHRDDVIKNNGRLVSFRGNGYDPKEEEADLFSAELLMPKKAIYTVATINKNGSSDFWLNTLVFQKWLCLEE